MKPFSLKATALALVACLASCGGDDSVSPTPQPPQAATTVMVYMVGSDLETGPKNATHNLEEMLKAKLPPNTNIVIETGGADVANDSTRLVPNWINVKRHVIANGKLQQVADLGKVDMGAPATLSDFIAWSKKQYPAGSYKLLMWDHGGGWWGFGGDENTRDATGGKSSLSLKNLTKAIQDGTQAANIRFDVIGFDACLMATVEVASALSPYSRYLLASQELEPGSGWNWTSVVASASQDPRTFGKSVADSYIEKQDNAKSMGTLSLIDLDRIGNVQSALESWSGAVLTKVSSSDSSWADVVWKRATALGFGGTGSGQDSDGFLDLIDLKQFARSIAGAVQGSVPLANAISQAVVYNNATSNYSNASGLSVYFPSRSLNSQWGIQKYQALDFSPKYRDFANKYAAAVSAKPYIHELDSVATGGSILADIRSDAGIVFVDDLLFSEVRADGTATLVGSVPVYQDTEKFRASLSLTRPLSGNWPTLNGYPVILGYVFTDDNGSQYWGVPVEVNGDLAFLMYQQYFDTTGNPLGWTAVAMTSSLDDSVPRLMPLPQPTDKVRVLAAEYDTRTGKATSLVPATPEFSLWNFDLASTPVSGSYSQAVMETDSTWSVKVSTAYPRTR